MLEPKPFKPYPSAGEAEEVVTRKRVAHALESIAESLTQLVVILGNKPRGPSKK
jgi:hypothetical protein